MIHAPNFIAPLLVELFGALFDGELIIAANESQ
jgi:hypothetical protein